AFAGAVIAVLIRCGVMGFVSGVAERHRKVLIFSSFLVAFMFPFTQNGSDANMSIATQVMIFAATAMGLNIVVGLAGLLDLGYIAFLGAGAFTAAILSRSAFSTIDFHPPFIVVVLISGTVSATLGLIIGSPTLRVSGDYLAIVTLAFGEIFRISMNNLDGVDGPLLTRGSNGIPAVPDLNLLGFDFGVRHELLGIPLGRFSNYYFLLLVVLGLIILVFSRLNNSRIGRGWVAIREDEKAAEAMGVNVFGLKLFAFAGGAFLAGVAGSVKAHQDISVTPDQYVFLESAFLLAAIVLGGMGTVLGVLIGATLLKLMPEKLRFVSEYRLLIFGLLLVIMMRFRPEGLVASQRRQLEFHEDDEELADRISDDIEHRSVLETQTAKGTT
ncbi:MAG TPA: branched-chain amino acid ABC transporter permease, partial [Propionibacteriaceae bacterium]